MSLIRKAKKNDVEDIVSVHMNAFEGFFLTLLGPRFLRAFYSTFMAHPAASLLVFVDEEKVVGFAAYTSSPDEFFKFVKKKYGVLLGVLMMPAVLMSPLQTLKKVVRAIRYRGDQTESMNGYALLSSIGVDPSFKGRGVGSQLIEFMNSDLKQQNVDSVYLTTDVHNNQATLAFYEKLGFSRHSKFVQSGEREMYRLTKSLDN